VPSEYFQNGAADDAIELYDDVVAAVEIHKGANEGTL
jgi:hypothetical protein